ncbi:MAG: B12-binding domain-containing radical SAM protein, partial [Calditrichia bacterium]
MKMTNMRSKSIKGAKITFINMPLRESALPNTPPLGPALLAARLRQFGAIPTIIDLNSYRINDALSEKRNLKNGRHLTLEETRDLIAKHFQKYRDQDAVALSGIITTSKWQKKVAQIVRNLQPDTFLVSGNGLATEIKTGLFNWVPELDGVVIGEGDNVILKIASDAKLIKERGLKSALLSKKIEPLNFINDRPRFLYAGIGPTNLDSVPLPAWDIIEEDVNGFRILDFYLQNAVWGQSAKNSSATPFTMRKSITTVSSRGCPFSCNFCYRGQQGQGNYRMRSVENLTKEIEWCVKKYGIDFFGMNDDNFMVSRDRIAQLVPLLKSLNIRWGT